MQKSLLSLAAFFAVCACVTASEFPVADVELETSLAIRNAFDKVRDGLDALQKFVDIFDSKIFDGTPLGMVAEILSKSLDFVVTIMDLINGSQTEDPMLKYLREQFAEVNDKLDGIALQLQDVKDLIEWSTARGIYARYELEIRTASDKYNKYLKASAKDRPFRLKEFLEYFGPRRTAAFKLYQGVVVEDLLVASSLADAVQQYTKNHRGKVMSFLLTMNRVILRGAQMEIAYQTLKESTSAGELTQSDWDEWIHTYVHKMKSVENSVKSEWHDQMKTDVDAFIIEKRELSNKDFARTLNNFLVDKFDWMYWITVAYRDVSGYDNHFFRFVQGGDFFRVAGNRNVLVGRADPKISRWNKDKAETALELAEMLDNPSKDCQFWSGKINQIYPVNGVDTTFLAVICWNCDVWFTVSPSRMAYKAIKCKSCGHYKERVNAIYFG